MANIFIIHGTLGHPEENWFPWLKKELEQLGHQVFVPRFPTPENQTLDNWLQVFSDYEKYLNPTTIAIGHSIGTPFLLRVIEDYPVQALYSFAGFASSPGNHFDESGKSFTDDPFNWEKIKTNCKNFRIYHADNDPYVPLKKAEELAAKLDTTVQIIKGAGHFNSAAGYNTFPYLLKQLTSP